MLECDWCGERHFGIDFNGFAKNHYVYRFKSISPLADEIWLQSKPGHCMWKHLSFCNEECAEEYFKENPEDRKFYKLIGHRK